MHWRHVDWLLECLQVTALLACSVVLQALLPCAVALCHTLDLVGLAVLE